MQTLVPRNVSRSSILRGAQHAPELALRSTDFCSPEKPFFSPLHKTFKTQEVERMFFSFL